MQLFTLLESKFFKIEFKIGVIFKEEGVEDWKSSFIESWTTYLTVGVYWSAWRIPSFVKKELKS